MEPSRTFCILDLFHTLQTGVCELYGRCKSFSRRGVTCGRQSGKEGLCHHGPRAKFVSPASSLYATATGREHGVRTASRSARSQSLC